MSFAMRSRAQLVQDIKFGYAVAGVGTLVCIGLVLVRLLGGEAAFRQSIGFSPGVAVLMYVAGGFVDGFIIAILRPLTRMAIGTFIVVFCAGIPLLVMAGMAVWPREYGYLPIVLGSVMYNTLMAAAITYGIRKGLDE